MKTAEQWGMTTATVALDLPDGDVRWGHGLVAVSFIEAIQADALEAAAIMLTKHKQGLLAVHVRAMKP